MVDDIAVRYFAAAADVAGRREESVSVTAGHTLADLVAVLVDRYGPDMEHVLSVSAFLVGDRLIRDLSHASGPAVDVLPPFAGG